MGVQFKVGSNVTEMLAVTWQKAKAKFWSMKHLLLSATPLGGRMKLFRSAVGGAALWNCCAFAPEHVAMEALNIILTQLVIWMMRLGKRSTETWVEFRQRSVNRLGRPLGSLGERWSTVWLKRWWNYCGRREFEPRPASTMLNGFRDAEWWSLEQRRVEGLRHSGRF